MMDINSFLSFQFSFSYDNSTIELRHLKLHDKMELIVIKLTATLK